jgi:hypothetical protein
MLIGFNDLEMPPQTTTQKEKFTPTPKMQEYLITATNVLSVSPSTVSASCSVARETWYDWLRVEGFEDWFYSEYKKARWKILPLLDSIAFKYAKQGSFKHLEALYNSIEGYESGNKPEQISVKVDSYLIEKYEDRKGKDE